MNVYPARITSNQPKQRANEYSSNPRRHRQPDHPYHKQTTNEQFLHTFDRLTHMVQVCQESQPPGHLRIRHECTACKEQRHAIGESLKLKTMQHPTARIAEHPRAVCHCIWLGQARCFSIAVGNWRAGGRV